MSRPDPVTGEDLRGLRKDTQGLTHSIEVFATKNELDTETARRKAGLLFVLAALAIIIGGGFYVRGVANDAREAVNEVTASRAESRKAVCDNDNHFIENHNRLVDANLKANMLLVQAATDGRPEPTAEQQARIDEFVAGVTAEFAATRVEPRDCSPAGIAAFYKGGSK